MDAPQTDPDRESSTDLGLMPTRRGVLVGTAAVLLADPVSASNSPTKHYRLEYLDKASRRFVALVDATERPEEEVFVPGSKKPGEVWAKENCQIATIPGSAKPLLLWDRRDFGPHASFEIKRKSVEHSIPAKEPLPPRIVQLPTTWTLIVRNASFPDRDGRRFNATFTFERAKVEEPWKVSATLAGWWRDKAPKLESEPGVSLNDFLGDAGRKLSFLVLKGERDSLLKGLFGDRIESEGEIRLTLGRELDWSIESTAARDASPELYVLDIPLEFRRLALRRIRASRDDESIAEPPSRAAVDPAAAPRPSCKVPGTFVQAPPPTKPGEKPAAPAKTLPPEQRLLFDAEAIHGGSRRHLDGLYGSIDGIVGFTQPDRANGGRAVKRAPLWAFDLATARLAGRDVAASLELDKEALAFAPPATGAKDSAKPKPRVIAAIRHWGDPAHTVAGCVLEGATAAPEDHRARQTGIGVLGRSVGRLTLRAGPPGAQSTEGPFNISGFELVRQLQPGRGVVTRIRLTPAEKEFFADLELGGLILSALPPLSPEPGSAPRVPPIEIEAIDGPVPKRRFDRNVNPNDGRRLLSAFEARFALNAASLALPDRVEVPDGGGPGTIVRGSHTTRLEFRDAEALLYLPALGPPPDTAADALIPIGPAPIRSAPAPIRSPASATRSAASAAGPKARAPRASSTRAGTAEPPGPNLPAGEPAPRQQATIHLGRAHLTVLRPSDLLSLKYRFSGLELRIPWPPAKEDVATLAPPGGKSSGRPVASLRGAPAGARDERPLLVVEFPPQHVVERAYFRRLPARLDLPVPTVPTVDKDPDPKGTEAKVARFAEIRDALRAPKRWSSAHGQDPKDSGAAGWRAMVAKLVPGLCEPKTKPDGTTTCERVALREAMKEVTKAWLDEELFKGAPAPAGAGAKRKTNRDFVEAFAKRAAEVGTRRCDSGPGRRAAIPQEQRIYAGPEFLEPDTRRIALRVLRDLKEAEATAPTKVELPDLPLDLAEWKALLNPFLPPGSKVLDPIVATTWAQLKAVTDKFDERKLEARDEIERAKERRDSSYAQFRGVYRQTAAEILKKHPGVARQDWSEYRGRDWFATEVREANNAASRDLDDAIGKIALQGDDETPDHLVPARLSGPSRIAFRVDAEDFEPDRKAGRIPFTLEGLTNWGGMDMAVVRRAERLMEPLEGERLPPRWGRRAVTDEGAVLTYQGISSGGRWTRRAPGRLREPARLAPTPAQRLKEVSASASEPPDTFQTAIELPFRLFLSPAQDATWVTSSPRVRRAVFPKESALDDIGDVFRELWTARLTGSESAAGLRAVWSPDFRPEALLSTAAPGAPPRGPHAPWALSRAFGLREPPPPGGETFRTGLEAYDRHELVVLSSVHGLPVLGRRVASGDLAKDAADQIDPPDGFRLSGLVPDTIDTLPVDLSAIYRPKPLSVTELSLSALGGNLDVDTGFQPPTSARVRGGNLFDAFSVERWRQRTVLGRDVVVEVVYKGFLFPIGHRASLVKLTERRFVAVEGCGPPKAVLIQRRFLRISKPEKPFPAEGQPNRGSRWPCEQITMLTRQSPDLVEAVATPEGEKQVSPSGRINLVVPGGKTPVGECLWPRTASRPGAEVWFEMQIGKEAVPVRMPLIFVDNVAANDQDTMAALVKYYNDEALVGSARDASPTRHLGRNGQPVVMAPEHKPADTSFETAWWRVTAEGRETGPPPKSEDGDPIRIDNTYFARDAFMEGQDQPPFYPVVDRASCRLGPVERLTGSPTPLWAEVAFDGDYVANGFDGGRPNLDRADRSEIYLRIVRNENGDAKPLALDFADRGDLGGGVARPTMDVVAISRRLGPINGSDAEAAGPPTAAAAAAASPAADAPVNLPALRRESRFNPTEMLPKAKFLGIVELKDLIRIGVTLSEKLGYHPKLNEAIEYGAASVGEAVGGVRAVLTDAVIKPAAEAIAEVEKTWIGLARQKLTQSDAVPTLDVVYPQIGRDLAALRESLRAAQDRQVPDADFLGGLATIYEAARRLIRSIEGIARDPLAAAAGSQAELYRKLSRLIADVRAAVRQLESLRSLPDALPDLLRAAIRAAVEDRIVAWLGMDPARVPSARAVAVVTAAVRAAVLAPTLAWTDLKALPGQLAEALRTESAGRADLTAADRQVIGALVTRLDRLAGEIRSAEQAVTTAAEAARNEAQARLTRLIGLVASESLAKAIEIIGAADQLKAAWDALRNRPFDPKAIVEALVALAPVFRVLGVLGAAQRIADLATQIAARCAQITAALASATGAFLPAARTTDAAIGDWTTFANERLLELNTAGVHGEDVNKLKAAADNVTAALRSLSASQAALSAALPAAGACPTPSSDLPSRLLAAARRGREVVDALLGVVEAGDGLVRGLDVAAPQAALTLIARAVSELRQVTYLSDVEPAGRLKALGDSLDALANALMAASPSLADELRALAPLINQAKERRDAIVKLSDEFGTAAADLTAADEQKRRAAPDRLAAAVNGLKREAGLIAAAGDKVLEGLLYRLWAEADAKLAEALGQITTSLVGVGVGESLKGLNAVYTTLVKTRGELETEILSQKNPLVTRVLDGVAREIGAGTARDLFRVSVVEGAPGKDRLDQEAELAKAASAAWPSPDALAKLVDLADLWSRQPAIVELFRRFGRLDGSFLRTVVVEALDLRGLRRELDRLVRELVPTRATLSYDLSTPVNAVAGIFIPADDTRLEITARTVINLREPTKPEARIDGRMGPFSIKLFGSFHAVTLKFHGVEFRAGAGRSPGFDVRFDDFVIGEQAEFLKQLEAFLTPPKGSLPPVRPLKGRPGIEASFGVNLGSFGVGTLSFSNVTLNAGARLPFGGGMRDEAEFFVSIGRTDAPFLISSTIFGGGGYLALLANGKGFIGLETSFDYGGVFAFGFGPLTGAGQITLGLYFRAARGEKALLGMNYMIRGAANIACFGISASLFVRLTYADGKMAGEATFTFSFSLGIDDIDYSVTVRANQGARAGQGSAFLDLPGLFPPTQYALLSPAARPPPLPARACVPATGPVLRVEAPSQREAWVKYRDLFDSNLDPVIPV